MLEREIETTVCNFAKSKGWLVFKFSSPNHKGVPDRIFIKAGRFLMIEFKAPGKKPTALQVKTINGIREQEVEVYVIDNVKEGKKLFA